METYDRWRLNIFRDDAAFRKAVFVWCVLVAGGLWAVFGYDGGVVMLERLIVTGDVAFAYGAYGKSFHFSAAVIYGLLFVAASHHLAIVGVAKTKNVLYSAMFVMLNVALFELLYMALFNHFQLRRNLLEWFVGDFGFLCNYFILLLFGSYGAAVIFGEKLTPKSSLAPWAAALFTYVVFLLWVFYPLPAQSASYGGWTSSNLFPQTHYAYVHTSVYVEDNLLHTVNLAAKSLFAATHYLFVRCLR